MEVYGEKNGSIHEFCTLFTNFLFTNGILGPHLIRKPRDWWNSGYNANNGDSSNCSDSGGKDSNGGSDNGSNSNDSNGKNVLKHHLFIPRDCTSVSSPPAFSSLP